MNKSFSYDSKDPFNFDLIYYISLDSSSENNLQNSYDQNSFNFSERNTNEITNNAQHIFSDKLNNESVVNNTTQTNSKGRKKKGENIKNTGHTRFWDDNSRRKIKGMIIRELLRFINKKIQSIYKNNIGEGLVTKKLMKQSQKQISNATIQFNLDFLHKTLGEIFSEDITGRVTNFAKDKNKKLIQELINEKDEEKRTFFQGLFNVTFYECLQYFRDDNEIHNKYLKGFIKFSDLEESLIQKEGKQYADHLKEYLKNYEIILNRKNPRNSKKNN